MEIFTPHRIHSCICEYSNNFISTVLHNKTTVTNQYESHLAWSHGALSKSLFAPVINAVRFVNIKIQI